LWFKAGLCLYLAALVYPLVFWYFHCTTFKSGDESGYLSGLDAAYSKIQSEGFSALPSLLRGIEGSHVMLGPELGLLPMFLSAGNVIFSYRVTLFFFYLLVLLYTFLNVTLICHDKALAVFLTCIIGSTPWLVEHAQVFYNEIAWIAAILAAVYHTQCCDGWQKKLHSLAGGLAIGLAICVRPMETFVTCLPLACFLIVRFRRRVTFEQAAYAMAVTSAAVILLVLRLRDGNTSSGRLKIYFAIAGGLSALAIIYCAAFRNRLGFKLWTISAVIPALLFWTVRIKDLYVHVYACTFGTMAKVNAGAIPNAHLLDYLKNFMAVLGYDNVAFLAILLLILLYTRRLGTPKVPGRLGYLWMALVCLVGVALTIAIQLASGVFDQRRFYLGTCLFLVFGLGWVLAQFNDPPENNEKSLRLGRAMAGAYAFIAIAIMTNCIVFGGTKPYGRGFHTSGETCQNGMVHAVNCNVASGAVIVPLGVSRYIDKDHAALLARLERSDRKWIVDSPLAWATNIDDAFKRLSAYDHGEYVVVDLDSDPSPTIHIVYHAMIRRIVDSYKQAVASNREVPGIILSVENRKYLLTTARDAVALARAQSVER
jgi:hypothetical protein